MDNNTGIKDCSSLSSASPSPHIKKPHTTRSIMITVLIALLPALIWGIVVFNLRALTITAISVFSCILFEFLYELLMKKPITVLDFSAAVTGMLIALILPVTTPLWMLPIAAFFAIVIVKQLFGGIGKNIVNPALAARVFLFSWADRMSIFVSPGTSVHDGKIALGEELDAITSATPLASLKDGLIPEISVFDMILGYHEGCIGEISALLLLIGGLVLLIKKVITWHTPVIYIATVYLVSLFCTPSGVNSFDFALYQILSGGLFLGAIFMATDHATSPVTSSGKVIFGIGCGLLTVFIRFFGGYAEGVSFAILIMNLLVWYIDRLTKPVCFGGEKNVSE